MATSGVVNGIKDTWYISWRELMHFARSKAALFSMMIQPIVWLLFMGNTFQFSLSSFPPQFAALIEQYFPNFNLTQAIFGAANYLSYFAPGVITMTMIFGGIFGGFSVVWDYRLGYLKKMLATPVSRTAIATGKIASSAIRAGIQATLIGIIVVVLMGVNIVTGVLGFVLAILIAMLLCLAFAGISLAVGVLSRNNMEAPMAVMNLLTLPLLFMSSAMFPLSMMPSWLSTLAKFNPVTYAVDPIRTLFISGWDWYVILPDIAIVGLFAITMIAISTVLFRRNIS